MAKKHNNENTPSYMRHQTQYSLTGKVNMHNRKPYRSKRLKAEAKAKAYKCDDGTYRSTVETLMHAVPREKGAE